MSKKVTGWGSKPGLLTPCPNLPPTGAPTPTSHCLILSPYSPHPPHPTLPPTPLNPPPHNDQKLPRTDMGQLQGLSRACLLFWYISWFDKHSVSGTPPLCQSSNKASPCLPEAPGIRHIHVAHQYPRLDCELPRGRAVLSICVPRAWGRDWHTVGISNVFLLLLLLSHFSRVRLCATP